MAKLIHNILIWCNKLSDKLFLKRKVTGPSSSLSLHIYFLLPGVLSIDVSEEHITSIFSSDFHLVHGGFLLDLFLNTDDEGEVFL
jgi:hypothetical protein